MNKTNKKSIVFGLKALSILAFSLFSLLIAPIKASAITIRKDNYNATPYIFSISPNSINSYSGANNNIVVAITGNEFIPNSIGRVNGSSRFSTFIDSSHLLITLNPNDTINTDGFYINVFNEAPGGGYSNAKFFTIKSIAPVANVDYSDNLSYTITRNPKPVKNIYPNTNQTQNTAYPSESNLYDIDKDYSDIASNAIFGTNNFLPSGLTQWVLFGIIILLIVIFIRRILGAKKHYEESPVKHA